MEHFGRGASFSRLLRSLPSRSTSNTRIEHQIFGEEAVICGQTHSEKINSPGNFL